jgi:hypothetical protein
MIPDEADNVRPVGSVPADIAHVYGVVPPVAVSVVLYGIPAGLPGTLAVLIESAGAESVGDSVTIALED